MSSTKRVVLTVVICTGLLIIYQYLFPPPKRPPKQPPQQGQKLDKGKQATGAKTDGASSQPAAKQASGAASTQPGKVEADPSLGPLAKSSEGQQVTLKLRDAEATFSTTGGTLRHWILHHPRYKEYREGKLQPVDLVQTPKGKGPWQLVTTFPESDFRLPAEARYRLTKRGEREVRYEWQSDKVRVSKHYVIDKTRPVIWMTLAVRNLTGRALTQRLRMGLYSYQQDGQKAGLANPYPRMATGLCFVNEELHRRSLGAITGEQSGCSAAGCGMGEGPVSQVGQVLWVAADDRYFLTALVPQGEGSERRCEVRKIDNRRVVETSLLFTEGKIPPDGLVSKKFAIYVGAKDIPQLDAVKAAGGGEAQLSESVEFGWFAVLCRPMLVLLKFFHSIFGNWGLAIILLTLVVKLLTLYPTQKSMRSMKNLQKVKPKIDALRAKYGNDKQRLNQEMMQLYKVHKINPFGGCLPMLLQMPIWFALYRTLGNAVELYRSPFFGWITDLTAPDPYYVLPIAMGLSMFAQQAISPQALEGTQAKMMKYFMPGMFTVMMLWLPAGLTLYIFINTLLSMLHQLHMNRTDPDRDKGTAAKATEDVPDGGGGAMGAARSGATPPRRERGGGPGPESDGPAGGPRRTKGGKKRRRKSKK